MKHNWAKLKIEFVTGTTLRELAGKYCIPEGTLHARCAREHWQIARYRCTHQLVKNVIETSVIDFAQELGKQIEHDLMMAKAIRTMIFRTLKESAGSVLPARDLLRLAKAGLLAQKIGRVALGVNASNQLPIMPQEPDDDLDLSVLTDEEYETFKRLFDKATKKTLDGGIVH